MALAGFNQSRPTKANYEDFVSKLKTGLEELEVPGLGLMIYGSYVRGDWNPGRSDIDGTLVFDSDVVINKDHLRFCSRVLADSLKGNNVPFQVTVTDRRTIGDGRFNSYNASFEGYFEEEGEVLVGPDYRGEFKFMMPRHPEQGPLTFNLRKCRQGLFFADHDRETDYEQFLRRFGKSLDAVSRGSKQILYMIDGNLLRNRFSALRRIPQEFPGIDVTPLAEIRELYVDPQKLDALYRDEARVLDVWRRSSTFFEQMIKAYLDRCPQNG